jgi:hypothetical protein
VVVIVTFTFQYGYSPFLKIMKRMTRFCTLLLVLFATFIFSCKKGDDSNSEKEFFNDGNHVFSYKAVEEDIVFYLDVLSDKTNGLYGEYPEIDLYRIYVDVNRNGAVDKDIDLMFSPGEFAICVAALKTEFSTSACSYFQEVNGSRAFGKTDNFSTPHSHFNIGIPKSMLSDGSKAKVAVHLYDTEASWSYFPKADSLFANTFELTW